MSDVWLLVRLAAATALLLAPGWALARAVGMRSASATLGWALTAMAGVLALTFALGASLDAALVGYLAVGVVAGVIAWRRGGSSDAPERPPQLWVVAVAGAGFGLLLWHVAGAVAGDGLFHLARVQKLAALDDLSLDAVSEFPDGGLHPGYAFPLWQGFLAMVARVSGAAPGEVLLHQATVLAPVAFLVAYEAGWAVFRRVGAATAALAAGVTLAALAPGHGGQYATLALPATASRVILATAAVALAFEAGRSRRPAVLATAAAASLALAIVHPTYAIFVWIPLAGYLLVRLGWRRPVSGDALALGALVVPAALFFAWLLPVIRDTASVGPGSEERERAIAHYAGQLNVRSPDSYSLVPELFTRTGAVAVAALLLVPLAGLAGRRRWAAYAAGGALAVLAVALLPFLFTPFSDLVSVSQARRLVGFWPLPYAFAGGIGVLGGLIGVAVAPVALGAGIALQLAVPGDFGYRLGDAGASWATWIAVGGGIAAVVLGVVRRFDLWRAPLVAAALFLLPVAVHGLAEWSPSPERRAGPVSEGLERAIREQVPAGGVVYGDPEASYQVAALAPVYVCVAPPGHVADTEDNRPYERVGEFRRFARSGDLSIPRSCGAEWLVVDRSRFTTEVDAPVVYRDERWALYRLDGGP